MLIFPLAVFFLSLSMVSALVVPRTQPPKGWLVNILEDYDEYHARYIALDCQSKHKSRFFHLCCHPLLKTQSLADRAPQCTPQSGDDDEDCDDGDNGIQTVTVPHVTSTPKVATTTKTTTTQHPTTTQSDDDDEDCDDGGDGTETVTVPHVTSTPVTTKVVTTKAPTTTKTTTTQHPTTTQRPTTTQHPTTTQRVFSTSTAPPPQKSSSGSQVFSDGFATFFFQKGNRGACGELHSDNDLIAAIDEQRYGNSGLKSALCGKKVKITNPANKKSVIVTIVDDCPSCKNRDSIDLSVAAFEAIAEQSQGMVNIDWSFV